MRIILVVEDNPVNMKLMRDIFKLLGLPILEATSAAVALQLLADHKPDLIITDIQLPDMSGLALTRTIRAMDDLADVPIMALSAFATKQDIENGLQAGCSEYLTKPIEIKPFMEKVQDYLGFSKT